MSKKKRKAEPKNSLLNDPLPPSEPASPRSLTEIIEMLKEHEASYFNTVIGAYRSHNQTALEKGRSEFDRLPSHTRDHLQDIFGRTSGYFGEAYREFFYHMLAANPRHEERLEIFKASQLLLFVHSLQEALSSRKGLEEYAKHKDAQSELSRKLQLQIGEQSKTLERHTRGLKFGPKVAGRKQKERADAARRDARQMFLDVLNKEPAWKVSRIYEHIQARMVPKGYGYAKKEKFLLRQIRKWTSGLKRKFIAEKNSQR